MNDETQWSAIELVDMLSEYLMLSPRTSWKVPKNNAPRKIRFKRIKSLCAALALPKDIATIVSGDFLTHEHVSYAHALEVGRGLFDVPLPSYPWPNIDTHAQEAGLQWTLRHSFTLRHELGHALSSGVQENSVFELLNVTMNAYQQAHSQLLPTLTKLDRFIGYLLDPEGRVLSEKQIIDEWNWPTDDLLAADVDNY